MSVKEASLNIPLEDIYISPQEAFTPIIQADLAELHRTAKSLEQNPPLLRRRSVPLFTYTHEAHGTPFEFILHGLNGQSRTERGAIGEDLADIAIAEIFRLCESDPENGTPIPPTDDFTVQQQFDTNLGHMKLVHTERLSRVSWELKDTRSRKWLGRKTT